MLPAESKQILIVKQCSEIMLPAESKQILSEIVLLSSQQGQLMYGHLARTNWCMAISLGPTDVWPSRSDQLMYGHLARTNWCMAISLGPLMYGHLTRTNWCMAISLRPLMYGHLARTTDVWPSRSDSLNVTHGFHSCRLASANITINKMCFECWMNEWMFNDTPARKTDWLLGVRKR